MMSRRDESWRSVSFALARRLSHAAGDYSCNAHSVSEADVERCPFCADRDAYRRFVAKARYDPWAAPAGMNIPLSEIRES